MIVPLAVYIAVIGLITLTPRDDSVGNPVVDAILNFLGNSGLTAWISFAILERVANVIMFVPLGVLLILALGRQLRLQAWFIGVGYSLVIETCQALFLPGRVADPFDVMMNGLGAGIGVGLAVAVVGCRNRRTATP
jgi:glycopeptide antibiotics resistance protein